MHTVRNGANKITHFNGFPISSYVLKAVEHPDSFDQLKLNLYMQQATEDFDDAQFDPLYCGLVVALILANERLGVSMRNLSFSYAKETEEKEKRKVMPIDKYYERSIDTFAEMLSAEHRSVCEPFDSQLISTLQGMVKSEANKGQFLEKFDLGCIPQKLHMIFLFFLRMNKYVKSLHARNINLKPDVIRYLLKDFVNLREFTLSFSVGLSNVVGGGYSEVHKRQRQTLKRREIGQLMTSILDDWH